MAEPAGERENRLRTELAALRIERSAKAPAQRPQRRGRTWLVLGLVALTAAALAAWLLSGGVRSVEVAYATRSLPGQGESVALLSGSGYVVTGDRYVSVGVRVPGRIEEYFIEEGQAVAAGAPLVRLDDRDYRAAEQRAAAALEVARANLSLAEAEWRRGRTLDRSGVISAQELDVLENKAEVARATVAQLEAELRQARVNLDYTVLRAPTGGVVLAKLKEVGEIAVPGGFAGSGDLVRLANLSDMRAEVDVNEADLSRVRIGAPAEVTPDAHPGARYAARVVKLYPQVDRQKGTLKVEVQILEPDERLLPDMSARVSFLEQQAEPGKTMPPSVLIPSSALRSDDAGSFVWSIEDGHAKRIDVEVADRLGDRTRIAKGLRGGEPVIIGEPPAREGEALASR
jgi:RND family efflux transporter MFP subunit